MRKKLVAMMLLACTVFTATACGNASDSASASESHSSTTGSALFTGELEKNVTIQVLENDTAISEGYFQELIDAFNEAYKDQGIQAVDANMDQYLDLANDGPYGYGPDVLYQANDVIMQYAEGKHILPLPAEDLDCYDQIPESAWEAYQT
jgi:arabinogalactan oligomer/maltooligosaccharide transport system substrate-binding protein